MYDKNILFFKSQLKYLEINNTQSFDEISPHSIEICEVYYVKNQKKNLPQEVSEFCLILDRRVDSSCNFNIQISINL